MNRRFVKFNKTREGQSFSLERPSFSAGTVMRSVSNVPNLKQNDRDGLGNYSITRPNFISPPIRGRETLDFEKLQAQDIETGGIKVQLGDKTIEKLFKIQVADPTDKKWIAEKERRLRAGETELQIEQNPPLGRPQRKISKMVNFGAQGLSVEDKIESIKAAVLQGNADNKNEMARVIASTAGILGNLSNLQNLTSTGLKDLQLVLKGMFIPKNWRAMGFTHRIFSLDQYREEAGLVNLYLLANLPAGRSIQEPLVSLNETGAPVGKTSLTNMVQSLTSKKKEGAKRAPSRYIDLQDRAIIPLNRAVGLANSGIDNGQLNGQNPPEDPPNNGAWLPDVTPIWDFKDEVPKNQQTQGRRTSKEEELKE